MARLHILGASGSGTTTLGALRLLPATGLRRRQAARYGKRIEAAGDMAAHNVEFLKWAEAYDVAGPEQRSLVGHEAWLATLKAPVLRLDSAAPLDDLVFAVLSRLDSRQ